MNDYQKSVVNDFLRKLLREKMQTDKEYLFETTDGLLHRIKLSTGIHGVTLDDIRPEIVRAFVKQPDPEQAE